MVVIPDLSAAPRPVPPESPPPAETDEQRIRRQYTKPCAQFVGGIRIGFGFRFERTCRPWNCTEGCGDTEHTARRQCRFFDFKRHQDVILRNKEAVERAEKQLGHVSVSGVESVNAANSPAV